MPKNITIYSRPTCAPCNTLKQFLNKKGIQFTSKNIDEDENAAAEAYAYAGLSIVPVTVVEQQDGTRDIITGLNLSKLMPVLA